MENHTEIWNLEAVHQNDVKRRERMNCNDLMVGRRVGHVHMESS